MPDSAFNMAGPAPGAGGPLCEIHPLPYRPDPAFYFERIRREAGAVLLDSSRPHAARGRFDILTAWPLQTLMPEAGESGPAFFDRLRSSLRALGPARFDQGCELPFAGGLLGYLAYDFGRRLEAPAAVGGDTAGRTGEPPYRPAGGPRGPEDDLRLPDARFGLYDWALTSDHLRQTTQLVFHPGCPADKRRRLVALFDAADPAAFNPARHGDAAGFSLTARFAPGVDRDTYRRAIAHIHAYIRAGDCYQVNYTQRFQASYRGDPWQAYRALRQVCPTPFAGYLHLGGDDAILSLSPERFLRLRERRIEARPIKGTRPRGATPDEDERQAHALRHSAKDRAENLMIVDLLRNDIGRSSRVGSVRVPELFSLESYPNVHHLVSSVTAELADGLDVFDLLAGSFPGGSITGAPKIRAMQIIDELEPQRRSLYCGSLLYIDTRGEMDSSITIRSLLAQGGRVSCWGGGGIVMDSDWEAEYQESLDKVGVLLRTLERELDE